MHINNVNNVYYQGHLLSPPQGSILRIDNTGDGRIVMAIDLGPNPDGTFVDYMDYSYKAPDNNGDLFLFTGDHNPAGSVSVVTILDSDPDGVGVVFDYKSEYTPAAPVGTQVGQFTEYANKVSNSATGMVGWNAIQNIAGVTPDQCRQRCWDEGDNCKAYTHMSYHPSGYSNYCNTYNNNISIPSELSDPAGGTEGAKFGYKNWYLYKLNN